MPLIFSTICSGGKGTAFQLGPVISHNTSNSVNFNTLDSKSSSQATQGYPPTFGIFLRLRLYGSPDRQGVSSGLLGVDGGLILYEVDTTPSLVLRASRSLKLRRSEVCLKKPGLEES